MPQRLSAIVFALLQWIAMIVLTLAPGELLAQRSLPYAPCAWPQPQVTCDQGAAYQSATNKAQFDAYCSSWGTPQSAIDMVTTGGDSFGNRYYTEWSCTTPNGGYGGLASQWFGYSGKCGDKSPVLDPDLLAPPGQATCLDGCEYQSMSGVGVPTGGACPSTNFDQDRVNTCGLTGPGTGGVRPFGPQSDVNLQDEDECKRTT